MRTTFKLLLTLVFLCAAPVALVSQTQVLRVVRGNTVLLQKPVDEMDSVKTYNGDVTFHYLGGSQTFGVADFDSVTFVSMEATDTSDVDTSTCVIVTWGGGTARVVNPYAASGITVTTSGETVTAVAAANIDNVTYLLRGAAEDGSFTLTSDRQYIIMMDGVSIATSEGPAIMVQNNVAGALHLKAGTTSQLSDGEDNSGKAVLHSKGALTIVGGGSLTVNGVAQNGIHSKGLTMDGGMVSVVVSGDQAKGVKSGNDITINGGNLTVQANGSVVMEASGSGYDPSYCTGIKADGTMRIFGGAVTVQCPSTNSGGKAISCDNDIIITGGTVELTALGACSTYVDDTGATNKYSSACLKADGNITIGGGEVSCEAGGRAISCDGTYTQTGGTVTTTTNAVGFTTVGTGTSCTDGFAAACLKADGDVIFMAGYFSGSSSGKGGRGIVADGTLTVGQQGAEDSLLHIYVSTSGAAVNASSGGGWPGGGGHWGESDYWKGLPKAIKIEDTIVVYSGVLQSYCSQSSGDPTGEAIESKSAIFFEGGYVEANAYDDAINAGTYLAFNGSRVWAYSRGNDAIDCNGTSLYVNDGLVIARGRETGFDDNADRGGHMYITGGTVIALAGNMGAIEGTPTMTGQKYLSLGSGNNATNLATNGVCVKNSDGTEEILTFRWPSFSGSGFEMTQPQGVMPTPHDVDSEATPKRVSGLFISTPGIQSGTYRYYSSPTISGGNSWHGLYTGATVTTSGNGTTTTAH